MERESRLQQQSCQSNGHVTPDSTKLSTEGIDAQCTLQCR